MSPQPQDGREALEGVGVVIGEQDAARDRRLIAIARRLGMIFRARVDIGEQRMLFRDRSYAYYKEPRYWESAD